MKGRPSPALRNSKTRLFLNWCTCGFKDAQDPFSSIDVRYALIRFEITSEDIALSFADELLLGGQRVIPNKALSSGFVFRHETLRSAFEAIL